MLAKLAVPGLFVLPRWFNLVGWAVAAAVTLMTLGKTGLALFSAHPIAMVVACAGLMTEAIGAYRSPGQKAVHRRTHRSLQMAAGSLMLLGAVAIMANKHFIAGKSIVPHTTHATVGALALALVGLQIYMGIRKHRLVVSTGLVEKRNN